jgi:hypothetical protein
VDNAVDLLVSQLLSIGSRVLLCHLRPGFEFFHRFSSPLSLPDDRFHIARGDDERGGAAVARDGYGLALHKIEELSELVLGFG